MATARIDAGICGFSTTVRAQQDGRAVALEVESDCEHVRRLAAALGSVEPFREITFRGPGPQVLAAARQYCAHAACPVPAGILKAVEVEAGLALPRDVTITLSRD